jgi:Tfp pilus assembly protein FimT
VIVSHKNCKGTSMMELMTICVLISILSALAIPSWMKYLPKMRTQAALRSVVATLRQARSQSISEKKRYGVFFDASNKRFVLFLDTFNPGGGTYDSGDSTVISTAFGQSVAFGSTTLTGSTVVFDMNGAASQSGTVTITTSDASRSYTIDILAATGRIKSTST